MSQSATIPAIDAAREDYWAFLVESGYSLDEVHARTFDERDVLPGLPEGVSIKASEVHGKGVFVERDTPAGAVLDRARVGELRTQVGRYLNHSPAPNAIFTLGANGEVEVRTLRNLEAGEEVFVNYRQAMQLPMVRKPKAEVEAEQECADAFMELRAMMQTNFDRLEVRAQIQKLIGIMAKLPQVEQPVKHFFADGVYVRVVFNPKGCIIGTKIHKQPNVSTLISGKLGVITEEGVEIINPGVFVTHPGTQRIIFALEDTYFSTAHPNPDNERDPEKLEARIIAKDFNELAALGLDKPPALAGGV